MNYQNVEMCKKCGGECCNNMSGHCNPSDFGTTKREIRKVLMKMLLSGNYAIDWWEGDPRMFKDVPKGKKLDRAYFIRPAVKGAKQVYDPSWGGECVFLTSKGCQLSYVDRPYGCRMLEPKSGGAVDCKVHGRSKRQICIAWLPYTKMILEIGHVVMQKRDAL